MPACPIPPGAPAVVPGPPYDAQGRASNGLLYADALASGLGLGLSPSATGGTDYAFGGARTRYQVSGPPFMGVIQQVSTFTALPGLAAGDALYVLWAGSNNLQDILSGKTTDALGNPVPDVAGTLGDIGGMLTSLYNEGARSLLVPNVANLARVPRFNTLPAPVLAAATGAVQAFNANLTGLLNGFQASHPDANIIRFDTYTAFEDLVTNAASLGFTNTTGRCYTGDDQTFTGGGTVCANPSQYVFWDGIHPTSTAHQILGQQMLAVTLAAAVPEPASWGLMAMGGLALLGWRRRRQAGRHAAQ